MGPHRLTSPEQTLIIRSIIGPWTSGFPFGLHVKRGHKFYRCSKFLPERSSRLIAEIYNCRRSKLKSSTSGPWFITTAETRYNRIPLSRPVFLEANHQAHGYFEAAELENNAFNFTFCWLHGQHPVHHIGIWNTNMADENGKLYRRSRECKPRIAGVMEVRITRVYNYMYPITKSWNRTPVIDTNVIAGRLLDK